MAEPNDQTSAALVAPKATITKIGTYDEVSGTLQGFEFGNVYVNAMESVFGWMDVIAMESICGWTFEELKEIAQADRCNEKPTALRKS